MDLTTAQRQQNKTFIDDCYADREQLFAYYISWHPKLYEGVDLDSATIDYINNYFYEYKVNPKDFDRHFLNALRHATPIYNNLKAIEFNKKVFNITTSKRVRKITEDTTNNIKENGTHTKEQGQHGSITDNGTIANTFAGTQNVETEEENSNDSKTANRKLPMQTNGQSFDGQFGWGAGASDISETKTNGGATGASETKNNSTENTQTTNIRSTNTEIESEDRNNLTRLAEMALNNKETEEEVGAQAVELILKIWNYLILPKSIDYLIKELESSFILILD